MSSTTAALLDHFSKLSPNQKKDFLAAAIQELALVGDAPKIKEWKGGDEYCAGDVVSYQNILYISTKGNLGVPPTCHLCWTEFNDNIEKSELTVSKIKEWKRGIGYIKGNIVAHYGILYVCQISVLGTENDSKIPPLSSVIWTTLSAHEILELISITVISKKWENLNIYFRDDVVSYDGFFYICVESNSGSSPPLHERYWKKYGHVTNATCILEWIFEFDRKTLDSVISLAIEQNNFHVMKAICRRFVSDIDNINLNKFLSASIVKAVKVGSIEIAKWLVEQQEKFE